MSEMTIGAVQAADDGTLRVAQDATVSFDTYFNALFERHWRLYTRAGALTLSLQVEGRAVVRVWRRSPDTGRALVCEQEVSGRARIALPTDAPHYRQAGLLWFDLTALGGPAVLRSAGWSTPCAGQPPARLGVVICTFNREPELAAVLAAVAGGEDLGTAVARVIVVNQGRPGLAAQPGIRAAAARLGPRLRMVEQANLGGAGGFGRGVLEALDDPAITHVCLLDDDVRVEPESLRRMAAFFTLAQDGFALGGHMLDSVRPAPHTRPAPSCCRTGRRSRCITGFTFATFRRSGAAGPVSAISSSPGCARSRACAAPDLRRAWQAASPRLTSPSFWRAYVQQGSPDA